MVGSGSGYSPSIAALIMLGRDHWRFDAQATEYQWQYQCLEIGIGSPADQRAAGTISNVTAHLIHRGQKPDSGTGDSLPVGFLAGISASASPPYWIKINEQIIITQIQEYHGCNRSEEAMD